MPFRDDSYPYPFKPFRLRFGIITECFLNRRLEIFLVQDSGEFGSGQDAASDIDASNSHNYLVILID
jgi:hypothetical protein